MKALAFRAEKDTVHWALVTGTMQSPILLIHERLRATDSYSEPDRLAWFRNHVKMLFQLHRPDRVIVHLMEETLESKPTAKAMAAVLQRARIEGILLELCGSLPVRNYGVIGFPGAAAMKPKRRDVVCESGRRVDWRGIPSISRRQAILAAASLLPSLPLSVQASSTLQTDLEN